MYFLFYWSGLKLGFSEFLNLYPFTDLKTSWKHHIRYFYVRSRKFMVLEFVFEDFLIIFEFFIFVFEMEGIRSESETAKNLYMKTKIHYIWSCFILNVLKCFFIHLINLNRRFGFLTSSRGLEEFFSCFIRIQWTFLSVSELLKSI